MKQLRQNAGVRAEEVAYKLDVSASTVRNWEQGRTIPKLRIDQFKKLLSLYGVSFDELFEAVQESHGKEFEITA